MQSSSQNPAFFASRDARRASLLCGALLVLSALMLYSRVVDFSFLYLRDDDVNVALNPNMGRVDAPRLEWMFTDWSYARRYIPLGWLGLSATYGLGGLEPGPYHAVGLGLFALNTGLVFALVLHVVRAFAARGVRGWDVVAAAMAAGWWALNPLRVETTAWVSGILYGQSMALLFVAVIAYLRSYRASGAGRAAWLILASAAYAGSLLTYPLALGVPIVLLGLDWLHSRAHPSPGFGRLLAEKAAFLVPLAAVLAVTLAARYRGAAAYGAVPSLSEFPLVARIAQSAYIAAYYVWKPWWPTHLSPLYDTLMDIHPASPVFAASLAAVGAASVFAVLQLRRRPAIAVAWFGYLATVAPFFGITERQHMAHDRYAYLSGVVAAAVVALILARVQETGARALAVAACAVLLGVLARMSWLQEDIWRSDQAQHAYVAAGIHNPELCEVFASRRLILDFMRGGEKAASDAVAAGLARNPSSAEFRKAEAIFAEKRRLSAYYGPVDLLAILQDQMGLHFASLGQLEEANDHFLCALREDDRIYPAAYDRALVLIRLGRIDDALRSYLLALRWAAPPLPEAKRKEFLSRLAAAAGASAAPGLEQAARSALAR